MDAPEADEPPAKAAAHDQTDAEAAAEPATGTEADPAAAAGADGAAADAAAAPEAPAATYGTPGLYTYSLPAAPGMPLVIDVAQARSPSSPPSLKLPLNITCSVL